MLRHIAIVTIVVNQLSAVEEPWRRDLGYAPVERGVVSAGQAALWAAPAMAGKPFVIMAPASGEPVHLRFIEDPAAVTPAPGTTFGWNAVELLVTDPDRLASQLQGSAFRVIGAPKG
ncbi:MAG: VOC family protein, partial [Gammaproteobacteria bacterium]|nr:VOC family protein [Gammaproteobacteria bacterium]